jgi:hypothetical protein
MQLGLQVSGILFLNVISAATVRETWKFCETRPWSAREGRRVSTLRVRSMNTGDRRTCPSCGNELSEAMEFCPVCMLRRGLAGEIESGESSASEDIGKPTQGVEIIVRVKASAARASAARANVPLIKAT